MRKTILRFSLGIFTLLVVHQQGNSQVGYTPEQIQQLEAEKLEKAMSMKGSYSPKSSRPEQDCESATLVCQPVYAYASPYLGVGNSSEIDPAISCLASGEVNSVWYKFTANTAGTVNFTITPVATTDDYDWAVYNITHASCAEILTSGILQVGCNFSPLPGTTGPNGFSGTQYTAPISVAAGDVFVVVVSNFSGNATNGFTIDFTASTADIYDTVPPAPVGAAYVCDNYGLRITTDKFMTCSTIAADGSDFTAVDAQGNVVNVIGAVGVGCASGEAQTYQVDVLLEALTADIDVTIGVQQGSDGNSVGGACYHMIQQMSVTGLVAAKPLLNAGDDHTTCTYWPYYPQLSVDDEWLSYQWSLNGQDINGETNNAIQPSSGGTYVVLAYKEQGLVTCHYADTVVIDVNPTYCDNSLPGGFTPNGDGFNDIYLQGNNITIINRWGQTLFEGTEGWDGTYAGKPVENGTYYVVFKYIDGTGAEKLIKEPLTLMR